MAQRRKFCSKCGDRMSGKEAAGSRICLSCDFLSCVKPGDWYQNNQGDWVIYQPPTKRKAKHVKATR